MKIVLTIMLLLVLAATPVSAHPGNTAADGCHYCRTNCDKWGVPWNERHCHGAPAVAEVKEPVRQVVERAPAQESQPKQIYSIPTAKPKPTKTPIPTRTPTPSPTAIPMLTPTLQPTTTLAPTVKQVAVKVVESQQKPQGFWEFILSLFGI